ncbi:PAS domain-containing sensor histidine kinase [Pedobacter glucosidilyticus]|uniref:PAS domain-containing sensor histidine kinase n=1 Tax=Pedobacter glucosidilyticus TaxID=1122941 RepID=UPI000421E8D9|nr:ATP-binding protein [Pedobacter glucosidilyticus]
MFKINLSFLKSRKGFDIPIPYFLAVFTLCIIPFVLSVLQLDINLLGYHIISFENNQNFKNIQLGKAFNTAWILFSVATGIFTCILTLIDFKVKKDISAPIIGLVLISTAIIDLLHLLVAANLIKLSINYNEALYVTWFASRLLQVVLLILGTSLILTIKTKTIRKLEQKAKLLQLLALLFAVITILVICYLFTLTSVSNYFISTSSFLIHPTELFIIGLFFLWGSVIMPNVIKANPSIFSQLLVLSMIPAIFAAVHMSIAAFPFDANYNVAQFLRLITYFIPLTGISLNYSRSISKQHQINLKLDREIQEKKKIQQDLESRQNLLKYAESMANMGSWEIQIATDKMMWSDALYDVLNLHPLKTKPTIQAILYLLQETDKSNFLQTLENCKKKHGSFQLEYQILDKKTEKLRFLQIKGQYIQTENKIIGTILDVTKLKEATFKLEQNEAILKEAESISHNGSFEWNESTNDIFWSDELYRIHGLDPENIKLDFGFYQTLIHPEDLERCKSVIEKAYNLKRNFVIEYRVIRPNKEVRFLYGTAKIITDDKTPLTKVLGTIQDITELKNTAILLEKTESIYKTIAKNVPDSAVIMFDKDYKLILLDGPIVKDLNFKTQPIIGISVKDLYHDDFAEKIKKSLDKAFSGLEISFEKEENNRFYKIDYVPVKNIAGEIFSVMVVKHDISEIKATQKDLESKVEELNRSNQDLEQFAYVASHDLQEPLRKIRAFGDRLQNKYAQEISEEGLDYIKRMQNASERMQILIDDLLTYSRVTRGDEGFIQVDLYEQIQMTLENLEYAIEKKGVTIDIMVNHAVKGIPSLIRQLFQNLFSNAIKFSKENVKPVIEVKSEIINGISLKLPGIYPHKDYCVIKIKDNGIGFNPEYADKIFALFQRLHTRNEYEGTGIGLAVCKKIVEKHEGFILADSKPDEGTIFTIILPY